MGWRREEEEEEEEEELFTNCKSDLGTHAFEETIRWIARIACVVYWNSYAVTKFNARVRDHCPPGIASKHGLVTSEIKASTLRVPKTI